MSENKLTQMDRIMRYADLIQKQTGRAVRPFRADGYVNLMNRYGTSKDPAEHYHFEREPDIPDDVLTMVYEGNGLFAKIIDTPAEEAIKHGFTLKDVSDQNVEDFYVEALDELDWEEVAMTAIRWARLFGGSIAVMLINDGGRLEDPLNWRNIKSIDDIRVYERAIVQPDYQSMYSYDPSDPFRTRGSRLGMPEFYQVTSRYGNFTVHDSRCLVFQNGILPENATNSLYQLWGIPEYVRIRRALKDAELAHESAPKLLDRSVQAIYKMQGLASLMATEQGENQVLRRLQVIDMARGMLNSLVIDADGEDYDFKTFQFNGITDVVSASCNMLSAITSIPQTILFGQGVGGMSSTDDTSMENYYNYVERIQKRMLRSNLRYLLSIIFQAGLYTGEVDEVPKINVEFNPLWSLTDSEQADLDQKKASTQLTKAQTVQTYVTMEAIDPSEVRKKLADSDEFDVETMLDEYEDDEDLFANMQDIEGEAGSQNPVEGQPTEQGGAAPAEEGSADYAEGVDVEEHDTDPGKNGSASPAAAPAATKLPQDMSEEEKAEAAKAPQNPAKKPGNSVQGDGDTSSPSDDLKAGVGVIVVEDGKILTGTRKTDFGYGLICGPGGHIKVGETPTQAAFRETEEEFGISPKELTALGRGPAEPDTEIRPYIFLCTDYEGEPNCLDREMADPTFRTMEELEQLRPSLFQPFADDVTLMKAIANGEAEPDGFAPFDEDGGPGSGNFGHEGRAGEVGGSAPDGSADSKKSTEKTAKLKEGFKHLKPNQKYAYISRSGIVPKGELESLKEGIRTGDQASMDKLSEYEQMYFDSAEYGRTVKTLDVEMRDEVAAMSDADAAEWAKKSMDRQIESHEGWANQYSAAQKVAIDMAVCETPQVVSRDDFDKYVKDSGAVVCYRGVKDIDSMTGENMQFQMAYNTQEPYFGDGIYGDGLYFSTRKDTAESYAGRAEIATCAVRPDAKVLEYGSPEHDKAKKRVQTTDDSVAALCSGYDVIHKKQGSNEDYYVILNRAALVMVDPVDDLADVAIKASERNAAKGDGKSAEDGGPGSGNHGHEGVPGQVGGSAPSLTDSASTLLHGKSDDFKADFLLERGMRFREVSKAMEDGKLDDLVDEKVREIAKERNRVANKAPDDSKYRKSAEKASLEIRDEPVEILVVYDKDGNEIGRNAGDTQGVKNSELDATYSTLHNHPGDADSCFSGADVRSFANTGEQVMYMTSTSKLYSLQKTSDYDGYSARSVATHMESLEKKYQDGDMTRNDLIAETDLYLQLHAHEFGLVYKQQDVSAKNADSGEKTLDFSTPADTIKSKGITNDGAPKGNDNAAGPHKRSHLSSSDKARYRNRIVGQKTSDGVQVKGFSDHAFDRIAQRNLSPKRIEDMLRSQNVSPDKTYQNRRCYDVKGSRLVLDHTTGTIVTIEWRKQNR